MTLDQNAKTDELDDHVDDAAHDEDVQADDVNDEQSPAKRSWVRRCVARWRIIVLALVAIVAAGLAVGLFVFQYRPDQQTNEAAAHEAVEAASDGTLALLIYTPDTFDADMADAKSYLTGDFLAYYSKFTDQIMAPAVKQGHVQANARLLRAAVSELHPDSAVVLLFIDQTTVSNERAEPTFTASAVRVELTKVNGSWLISKFEPV